MYSASELRECMGEPWFRETHQECEKGLLLSRLGKSLPQSDILRLRQGLSFSASVLASAADWDNLNSDDAQITLMAAADIEAAFASFIETNPTDRSMHLLRSALLYELGSMPGTAASHASANGMDRGLTAFFTRDNLSPWGSLRNAVTDEQRAFLERPAPTSASLSETMIYSALGQWIGELGNVIQGDSADIAQKIRAAADTFKDIARQFSLPLSTDILAAFARAVDLRLSNATLDFERASRQLADDSLKSMRMPSELWPAQRAAISAGLLRSEINSFGLAAPTGTGKTALTRLLLAEHFVRNPGTKAFYVCPSRALTAQIGTDLHEALDPLGIKVVSLGGTLTFAESELDMHAEADVLVFTPEKADLLMRIDSESVQQTSLVVVDEAHHIEQGTRGILLEFYLWRLRSILPKSARVVQLSAVAPNIRELVEWLGEDTARFAKLDWRSSRLRLGQFERLRGGSGVIKFEDGAPYEILAEGECPLDRSEALAQLALKLSKKGIVLLLCTSPKRAEDLAKLIAESAVAGESVDSTDAERLDARIERELYPEAALRETFKKGIAYHHAQLPPRVRLALEKCIAERHVDIVCATTTLAEGVNFPFSTVLVESLVGRSYELSPRALWNIAGRAGRFGVDTEGHCILFRPSLYEKNLKHYALQDYLSTGLDNIPPVRAALGDYIGVLREKIENDLVSWDQLDEIDLSEVTDREARGLLNVMRVGYAHAATSGTVEIEDTGAAEFSESQLLSAKQIGPDDRQFAVNLAVAQRNVVRKALEADGELLRIAAKVGWSLETQNSLWDWLTSLANWQLEKFGHLVIGGRVRSSEDLGYAIGPLAKRMTEFSGESLGGFTSYIAKGWIEGRPLTHIRDSQSKRMDFGRLVHVIYARIQYMLPWALFGLNELTKLVGKNRRIHIGSGLHDLSILSSEGVPSFDALNLVMQLGIERVDATRLAAAFNRSGTTTDIFGWFRSSNWNTVVGIVRAQDNRRLDPDLRPIWQKQRDSQS